MLAVCISLILAVLLPLLCARLFHLNVPNTLSLFRILLMPCFVLTFFQGFPGARYWAAGIYTVAFLTDIADGYIARSTGQITKLGRVLDPMADKLMFFSVLICITVVEIIPVWALVIFFLKELSMLVGGLIMLKKVGDVIPANWLGKASTGTFFVVCAILVLFPQVPKPWATGLISAALVITVAALLNYLCLYLKAVARQKKEE